MNFRPGSYDFPSRAELEEIFLQKYGQPHEVGWAPKRRWQYGYYLPADVYEAVVKKAVFKGCSWIDIGGGQSPFPDNPQLAHALATRCSMLVTVDPSENVLQNPYAHQCIQSVIEKYQTNQQFDLATLRMVVEHVVKPEPLIDALARLLVPQGVAIVFTVNLWSPLTLVSRLTPFRLHDPIKKRIWGGDEKDTFPVKYRMNSSRTLRTLFDQHGFREVSFAYLDDLSTWGRFRSMNYIELLSWRFLQKLRLRYPEHCLLGVYQKKPRPA
jgi:2-polyprenyl-3-methyl-5-hydroxy-6-metoxy-1,4-benzoquinol methylase